MSDVQQQCPYNLGNMPSKKEGSRIGVPNFAQAFPQYTTTTSADCLQVYPSNYMKAPDTWEQVFAPLSTCTNKDLKQQARPTVTAPAFLHESSDEVFVGIIDPGAAVVDAPAMPPDVLDLVKLFVGRPHIW